MVEYSEVDKTYKEFVLVREHSETCPRYTKRQRERDEEEEEEEEERPKKKAEVKKEEDEASEDMEKEDIEKEEKEEKEEDEDIGERKHPPYYYYGHLPDAPLLKTPNGYKSITVADKTGRYYVWVPNNRPIEKYRGLVQEWFEKTNSAADAKYMVDNILAGPEGGSEEEIYGGATWGTEGLHDDEIEEYEREEAERRREKDE
jgi:hypothetical protein